MTKLARSIPVMILGAGVTMLFSISTACESGGKDHADPAMEESGHSHAEGEEHSHDKKTKKKKKKKKKS